MTISHLDVLAKLFSQRRASRLNDQVATPSAIASGPEVPTRSFLFVQSFEGGAIAPKDGTGGTYTLTLQHGLGQTLFFSDRPDRVVGTAPTQQFLDNLGFSPDNPPNAALVADQDGETEIVVVELTNPSYDRANSTATYDITVLGDEVHDVDMHLQWISKDLAGITPSFARAHLFIDDCPDREMGCYRFADNRIVWEGGYKSIGSQGFCWSWSDFDCLPCDSQALHDMCYSMFPDYCNDTRNLTCAVRPAS